jgi:hypothetical protein
LADDSPTAMLDWRGRRHFAALAREVLGGINMTIKTFFMIFAVLAVGHGIGFVLRPQGLT